MSGSLVPVLERARHLGFLGAGPISDHIDHARGFAVGPPPELALDLGSGGGVPGLVLALHWPDSRWVLLDAGERRAAWLEQAVAQLNLHDRVTVVCQRAEEAARAPAWRAQFDLVVARSFGSPAVTAECAAGFLRAGASLVVSEPPHDDGSRWPSDGLATLALEDRGRSGGVRILHQLRPAPETVPRRTGVPSKRPRW